jgi:hypothetical protein
MQRMRVATLKTCVIYMISSNQIGDPFEGNFGKKKRWRENNHSFLGIDASVSERYI